MTDSEGQAAAAEPMKPEHAAMAQFGPIEITPLSRLRQLGARHMARSWAEAPHVTHNDEADVTDLEALRRRLGLTALPFVAKAVVSALKAYPYLNASRDSDGVHLILKRYFHVGFAIDTPQGLTVGVVRDCDQKPVEAIGEEIARLAARAREKGLSFAELSGGCFTISSLGAYGGVSFTPIINLPEVAILGVSRTQDKPRKAADGGVEWRRVLPLSLSYDHRVVNGAEAAKFTTHVCRALADPEGLG